MTPAEVILGLVTLQRLGELVLAKRNTDRLRARGAYEVAAGHYPLIVVLHGAWLAGLWYFVVYDASATVDGLALLKCSRPGPHQTPRRGGVRVGHVWCADIARCQP